MPRQARLEAPGTLHHVMGRRMKRAKIFRTDAGREDFLSPPGEVCREEALGVSKAEIVGFLGVRTSAMVSAAYREDLSKIQTHL
jgi:hypothetical protein